MVDARTLDTKTRATLRSVATTATLTCPRIVRHVVKASHGTDAERRRHLQEARRLCREFAVLLEVAEAQLDRSEGRIEDVA